MNNATNESTVSSAILTAIHAGTNPIRLLDVVCRVCPATQVSILRIYGTSNEHVFSRALQIQFLAEREILEVCCTTDKRAAFKVTFDDVYVGFGDHVPSINERVKVVA